MYNDVFHKYSVGVVGHIVLVSMTNNITEYPALLGTFIHLHILCCCRHQHGLCDMHEIIQKNSESVIEGHIVKVIRCPPPTVWSFGCPYCEL